MSSPSERIRQAVRGALDGAAMGARRFERARGLKPWALRGLMDPERRQIPSVDRAAEICEALGLELTIGPPPGGRAEPPGANRPLLPAAVARALGLERGAGVEDAVRAIERRAPAADRAEALRSLVEDAVKAGTEGLRADVAARLPPPLEPAPATRQVEVVEFSAAAGGGAEAAEERTVGALAFRRDWLESQGLDPTRCVVIGVRGASMEPTLPDGARILVNRNGRRRRAGRLYVLRTGDGLIVKRAARDTRGWLLLSDNPSPDYAPARWPDDAETIGEVRWMARAFA